jgi:cellulose biosynthesis protein BcsQ
MVACPQLAWTIRGGVGGCGTVGPMALLYTVNSAAGGTGKTTVTLLLAEALARTGHRTLVVDLDLNGKRSTARLLVDTSETPTVAELLSRFVLGQRLPIDVEDVIVCAPVGGGRREPWQCDLLPADGALVTIEPALQTRVSAGADQFAGALRALPYDVVLLDPPGAVTTALSRMALDIADRLVPVVDPETGCLREILTLAGQRTIHGVIVNRRSQVRAEARLREADLAEWVTARTSGVSATP